MKVKIAIFCLLVLLLVISTGAAQATLITFDDINAGGYMVPIANGYNGFDWNNFWVIDKDYLPASGYLPGTMSGQNIAFNGYGNPATMLVSGPNTFDLNSAYCTSAFVDNIVLTVEGFLGGVSQGFSTTVLSTTTPTFINFNLLGIDSARFSCTSNEHFGMDNLTVNAVPEPASLLGVGLPVLVIGLSRLRGLRK